jgi:Holliday junction resolvase RusA-like endonuclease
VPPTATAQQQKTAVINGCIRKYDPKNVKAAKNDLFHLLRQHQPTEEIKGPLFMEVVYRWPYRKSEKKSVVSSGVEIPRETKPDCDNIVKGFNDVLTKLCFYHDDAQIARLHTEKTWGPNPGIGLTIYSYYDWKEKSYLEGELMRLSLDIVSRSCDDHRQLWMTMYNELKELRIE